MTIAWIHDQGARERRLERRGKAVKVDLDTRGPTSNAHLNLGDSRRMVHGESPGRRAVKAAGEQEVNHLYWKNGGSSMLVVCCNRPRAICIARSGGFQGLWEAFLYRLAGLYEAKKPNSQAFCTTSKELSTYIRLLPAEVIATSHLRLRFCQQ